MLLVTLDVNILLLQPHYAVLEEEARLIQF